MKRMEDNQLVAGLWCSDVLGHLSDYLDGDLPAETRSAVDGHLAACANCARFGADIAGLLQALPRPPGPLPDDLAARLRDRLSTYQK